MCSLQPCGLVEHHHVYSRCFLRSPVLVAPWVRGLDFPFTVFVVHPLHVLANPSSRPLVIVHHEVVLVGCLVVR